MVADTRGGTVTPLPSVQAPHEWPDEWREAYEERVAIMIFDGGLTEAEARERALESVRREFAV
jgi:hypothetical protein